MIKKDEIKSVFDAIIKRIHEKTVGIESKSKLVQLTMHVDDFSDIISKQGFYNLIPIMQDLYFKSRPFIYSIAINKKTDILKIQLNLDKTYK